MSSYKLVLLLYWDRMCTKENLPMTMYAASSALAVLQMNSPGFSKSATNFPEI